MNDQTANKPEHMNDQDWLLHLQWMADMGRQASEGYAEHLARVTQDADHSKALLQANYRALHADVGIRQDMLLPGKD